MIDQNSVALLSGRFPAHFIWGVASSAFQIEGASNEDGRGRSIWDDFCRIDGTIADGTDGRIACDHYHRMEQDLDLIAALGLKAYRFSIAWPRIQPTGTGAVNRAGLGFYSRLIDGLLRRGIEPYATLYHWDLPATLQQDKNGWVDRDTAFRFADYATLIAQSLGDRVKSIATHNEPWVTATLGYELGVFAPGIKDRAQAMQASHHCLLSHGLASQAMRAIRPKLDVGIVLNLSPVYAASEAASDQELAAREDGFLVRWYMDALLKGAYPEDMLKFLKDQAPRTLDGDAAIIRQKLDFLGVNYYHPIISNPSRPFSPTREGAQVTDMGWEVAPSSFTELLLRLDRDYELPPLFITENGAAYRDTVIEGGVRDEERRAYIESHVRAVADAVDEGVDVRGYFVWSLLDNFEWAAGYTKRFGIYYVDYPTQARILKRSGFWFKNLAAEFQRNHLSPQAAKPRH